jgi:hypothetical protein
VATTDVAGIVSVMPTVVVETSVNTVVAIFVAVWRTSTVFVLYLVSVVNLNRVTYAVAVGFVTVDHVLVGWLHCFVVVR